jgi:hypothetical protein
MSTPTISAKGLTSVTELMTQENLQFKKCLSYANQVVDGELKALLGEMAKCHKERYTALNTFLQQQ